MTPLEATQAMYDAARAGRWDAVEELMADDFVIYEPDTLPYGGEWKGRDALKRLYTDFYSNWIDPEVKFLELVGGKTYAVALMHFTATPKSSGKRFSQHIAEVTRLNEDGKLADMRIHYFDTGEMARMLAPD